MNLFKQIFLRLTNKKQYNTEREIYHYGRKNRRFIKKLSHAPLPNFHIEKKESYSFKHSGNSGDIIYALPAIYALSQGSKVNLYLHLDQPAGYAFSHPLGNVSLNNKVFDMLQPLLMAQPQISMCDKYHSGITVDYDMDIFRQYPFPLAYGNIARWYFLTFAINADLGKPWLFVDANQKTKDYIVIARSQRYHSPGIDYSFLSKYNNLLFVGLKDEYDAMRQMIPTLQYQQVNTFLELAQFIKGSKLFIGNQSFPFSIAEALKMKRLLEVCFRSPNVSVEGINGFDFCYQPQFETLVERIMSDPNN